MISLKSLRDRYRVKDDPLFSERRIELTLVILGGVLFVQLLVGFWHVNLGSLADPIQPSSDILNVATVVDTPEISPKLLRELIERPLFWEGRKQLPINLKSKQVDDEAKAQAKAKAEAEAKKKKVVQAPPKRTPKIMKHVDVLGIFGGGGSGGAILNVRGKEVRLLLGESLDDGWVLSEMEPNRLVFKNGDDQDERFLRRINPLVCKMDPVVCSGRDPYGRKWVRQLTLGGIEE